MIVKFTDMDGIEREYDLPESKVPPLPILTMEEYDELRRVGDHLE